MFMWLAFILSSCTLQYFFENLRYLRDFFNFVFLCWWGTGKKLRNKKQNKIIKKWKMFSHMFSSPLFHIIIIFRIVWNDNIGGTFSLTLIVKYYIEREFRIKILEKVFSMGLYFFTWWPCCISIPLYEMIM